MKTKKKTNLLNLREKDPFLKREQQKYEHPLPSREWIIRLLDDAGVPQKISALAEQLSISDEEYEFFERRIKAMARDGQVLINRRNLVCVADKLEIVKCRVEVHKDDLGFAVPLTNDGGGDFVLYERQLRGLMHGDLVTVRPTGGSDRRGRREGQVLDIIERAQTDVVGRFYLDRGVAVLEAEDRRLHQPIILEPESVAAFKPESGQVIVAAIESYPTNHRPAVARVTEVLGDYADSGMEIEIAVRKHRLPHEFSENCVQAAAKIPEKVRPADRKGREDLRDLPLVTIDGESSRDFDDAVYAEKQGRNYRLIVAIADVSHYVRPHDAIDSDARERATSVYFPRRVIPMLPESLSNGICSLNPDVERLCMVCDMTITYAGNVKEYRFYPAVMRSHGRLTYNQVWDWLESGADNPHRKNLDTLYALFKILHKKRLKRGAMEFETTETEMLFDDHGKIERIEPVHRNDAHKLIEECMLAANVCAADFLLAHKHPGLYRNHAGPTAAELAALHARLVLNEIQVGGPACSWAAATTPHPSTTPNWPPNLKAATTANCCKPCCCARCSRPCTKRKTKAISAWPTNTTPTSPPPSAAILTLPSTAPSKPYCKAKPIRKTPGPRSAPTPPSASAAPTKPAATSKTGSKPTICATKSAKPSPAASPA